MHGQQGLVAELSVELLDYVINLRALLHSGKGDMEEFGVLGNNALEQANTHIGIKEVFFQKIVLIQEDRGQLNNVVLVRIGPGGFHIEQKNVFDEFHLRSLGFPKIRQ